MERIKKNKVQYFRNRYIQLYLLAILPFAFVLIFNYIPMSGVLLAFKDYSLRKGIFGSPWAGFKYFRQLCQRRNIFDP